MRMRLAACFSNGRRTEVLSQRRKLRANSRANDLRVGLPNKFNVERVLHRRLVVLADQTITLWIMREHVGRPRVAYVVEFNDHLKACCTLHPDRARYVD